MVQGEIRAEMEEERRNKMVAVYQQGTWTKVGQCQHIKFIIQSVYDVLPSPTNLQRWGLSDTAACQLCKKRGTLERILSWRRKALGEGRYRWRHDQILSA